MLQVIVDLDRLITVWINGFIGQWPFVEAVLFYIHELDLVKGAPFMAALWYLWFKDEGAHRSEIATLILSTLVTIALSQALQALLPYRPRPLHDPALGLRAAAGYSTSFLKDYSSFPSDNAAAVFAMSFALLYISRLIGAVALAWSAAIVCFPRAFFGLHSLLDLLAGAALGAVIVTLGRPFWHRLSFGRAAETAAIRWPAEFHMLLFALTYEMAGLFKGIRALGRAAVSMLRVIS